MSTPPVFELPKPELGEWRAGNTGTEGVWRFDSGQPGPRVMISALVHGNELCGAWGLVGLLAAGVRPQKGSLTLVLANLAAFDKFDPAHWDDSRFVDEDLNRVWQADKLADPNTTERRRALQLLPFVNDCDWLLDLHSMSDACEPLQLAGMQPRNLALAQRLGAPAHVVVDAGHPSGTRLRDLGRFGADDGAGRRSPGDDALALLVECGFHGALSSRDIARDQCVRFLTTAGTLDMASAAALLPGWRGPDAPQQWAIEVSGPVVARSAGFKFNRPLAGLEVLPLAGTLIGDNDGEPVHTPYDDCVMVMPYTRPSKPGVTVLRFARRRLLGA